MIEIIIIIIASIVISLNRFYMREFFKRITINQLTKRFKLIVKIIIFESIGNEEEEKIDIL